MTMNLSALFQLLMGASIIGLFSWVFRMQSKISEFVTWENMRDIQASIDRNYNDLHTEIKNLSIDLAYLRGHSDKSK